MADLEEKFQAAADHVDTIGPELSEENRLKLYALYKQGMPKEIANEEIVDRSPDVEDVEDLSRYDEWAEERAKSEREAMEQYVQMVDEIRRERR